MKRIALASLVVSPVLLLGCSRTVPSVDAAPATERAQVVQVLATQQPQTIQTTGTLHAKETAAISAQLPGRIRQVVVHPGDRVHSGDLLVTLDDAAMQSALSQAMAGETAAEKQQMAAQSEASLAAGTLARYEMLKQQKSVSPQEFDEVQKRAEAAQLRVASCAAQTEQAKAAVAGARTQLGYAALHAPFSGIVTARLADPGTLASPGVPLLQIDRDGPLQIYISVDESLISAVRLGMTIPVNIDGSATPITGTVAQIVPAADPASRSFLIKLDLPTAATLHAGMYSTATISTGTKAMILVPGTAVVQRGSLPCVYALDANGIAQLRFVTLGVRHGDQLEILSGLSAGDSLVNNPGDRDLAGKRVESENGARP